ncbi:MAG: ABC transporter substrate-binding protein [Geobacteraceae bacterium]|nr:ABC transporter substrate-binding protein [Geobacteraceae bacterium]
MFSRFLKIFLPLALVLICAVPSHAAGKLVAAVLTTDIHRYRDAHRAFVRTLAQKGYDQSNTEIILQTPNPDLISWANTIRKFEALGADIIVTYGAPVTLAAMRETRETPIVFVDVYGPVETGISRSMTMTGKNLCGVSSKVPMITLVKTLQEFREVRNMGVIYSSREAGSQVQLQELKRVAAQLGFAVVDANISSPAGLDSALSSMLSRVDSLYVSECAVGSRLFEKIVARANSHKVPVISQMPDASEKGALVALEVSPAEQGQLAGESAVKVLNGAKPGQLPIVTPKKIELIINMRAAKALDLHVPFQGLSAATKILK